MRIAIRFTSLAYGAPVTGRISEKPVLGCSLECQLDARLGYQPDANDRADVALLAGRFGFTPPASFGNPTDSWRTMAEARRP